MAAISGEVYYGHYEFPDGGISTKFILVLYANSLDDRVITCIATKVPTDKNRNPGCHFKTQRFFIPAGKQYFDVDTYLELLRLKEFSYKEFPAGIEKTFVLDPDIFAKVKDCLKKFIDDIPSDLVPLICH